MYTVLAASASAWKSPPVRAGSSSGQVLGAGRQRLGKLASSVGSVAGIVRRSWAVSFTAENASTMARCIEQRISGRHDTSTHHRKSQQGLRRWLRGPQGHQPAGGAGRLFCLAGPQWRGQIHHHRYYLLPGSQSRRQGSVFDVDIDQDFPAAKKHIGIVPQEFNFNQFEKGWILLLTRPATMACPGTGAAAGREVPEGAGAVGQARCALAHVVRRHEAAPDDRPRAGA